MKIVVVDDDLHEILKDMLQEIGGHEIRPFSNNYDAINPINMNPPDLVLSDVLNEGMNGVDFLDIIKPVKGALITGFNNMKTAYPTLQKPFTSDQLKRFIEGLNATTTL